MGETESGLGALNPERKVALLSGADDWRLEAVPELGLAAVMVADGPHGLRKVASTSLRDAASSTPATCFPTAAALGSSWDRDLLRAVGVAIADEARASGVAVVLGPGINIKRHPCCGRSFEYLSEDPLLTGELAAAYIDGVQSRGVGTSIKHFAANNQESHRLVVDAVVDERALREIYLRGFEIAITRAQPWTVMAAYNRLNGTYCTEHPWLLDTVLRREWGFEGLVVSDWGATNDRVAAIRAGMDLEMPGGASTHDSSVLAALDDGTLAADELDACVERVLALLRRSTVPLEGTPAEPADLVGHHALARRAAAESTVLLTNDRGVLPLDPTGTIAVIGAFAEHPRFQGGGSSKVHAATVDRALGELLALVGEAGGQVRYAAGYDADATDRPDLVQEAAKVAVGADVAVVFAGLPDAAEYEGVDREHLGLPAAHERLIAAVAAANPDTVVVLSNGAPVEMPWVGDVAAVVEGYLGGEAGGGAIADVLCGVAEPGGRLAESFPVRLADVASDRWFPGSPRQVQYRESLYVGYRWFDTAGVDVLFPFGHGLSYTTFALDGAALSADRFVADASGDAADDAADGVTVSVDVTNTGARSGSEVVQVYVRPVDALVHAPDRELRAFEKVRLAPGERTTVRCTLDRRAFAHWDVGTGGWQVSPGRYEVLVGTSSRTLHARLPLDVESSFTPAPDQLVDAVYRDPAGAGWDVDDAAYAALLRAPLPEPEPERPFHRNSTVGDLARTPVGRPIYAALTFLLSRVVGRVEPGGVGAALRVIDETPLRTVAAFTRGHVSLQGIDRLIAFSNRLTRSTR